MWRGVDEERRARRLRWMGRSWRKIVESLRGVSRGGMKDGVVNGKVHILFAAGRDALPQSLARPRLAGVPS